MTTIEHSRIETSGNGQVCSAVAAGAEVRLQAVNVDGRRVAYRTAGADTTGPTVLLIHGSGVSSFYWIDQLHGLGQHLAVMAVDLPGHGGSEPIPEARVEAYADAVGRFLEVIDAGPVIAVGHSLGGAVALTLAARRSDMVRSLVLLSSCVRLPHVNGPAERLLPYLPGPLRKLLFFAMARKILFAPGASGRAVRLGIDELWACRPETILNDMHAAQVMDLTERARGLEVPTLILCGSRDNLTPPALSQRLNALIPRSRLKIIDGCGHMLLLEVPERVNQEILDFVGSVLAAARVRSVRVAPKRATRPLVRRLLEWGRALLRPAARTS